MISNNKSQTNLTVHDFWYDLPQELIAQEPSVERDGCRLLVADREREELSHHVFREIINYLNPGDVLVINDSKVIPARMIGKKSDSGIDMEVLLLRQIELNTWEALTRPGRRAKIGTTILFGDGLLRAEVVDVVEGGNRILQFTYDRSEGDIYTILDRIGKMPLPPYITKPLADNDQYQTVYARERGSAAAPTAGLHFTPELLEKIRAKGIQIAPVMLHVGLGTFRPVKVERIDEHLMHSEFFSVSEESAEIINSAKAKGGRIVAVGTTSCRVLESASDEAGVIHPMHDDTQIFIYPGYRFKAVDALITNFHLPESTLLMLVSALSSREFIMKAYEEAIKEKYRFFSFGDAMLIQ